MLGIDAREDLPTAEELGKSDAYPIGNDPGENRENPSDSRHVHQTSGVIQRSGNRFRHILSSK